MHRTLFSLAVLVLNKISNVRCHSSSEYFTDSDYGDDSSSEYESESYEDSSASGSYESMQLKLRGENNQAQVDSDLIKRFLSEMKAGSPAELFGTNQHDYQPYFYKDLSRRFVPQYLYTEVKHKTKKKEDDRLTPKLASPELVLAVAKMSAVLEASKPLKHVDPKMQKEILRNGEYWNDVWREDVNPESLLRTQKKKKNLETMLVKVEPGSNLYDVVSKLKSKSPRLLYIINTEKKK